MVSIIGLSEERVLALCERVADEEKRLHAYKRTER